MCHPPTLWRRLGVLIASIWIAGSAHALSLDAAQRMATGESDERVAAIAAAQADEATVAFLKALLQDAVKFKGDRVWVMQGDQGLDPVSGQASPVPDDAEDVVNNNRLRGEIETALAGFDLLSTDLAVRRSALKTLQAEVDISKLPLLEKALAAETDATLKAQIIQLRAAALLTSEVTAQRLQAAKDLADSGQVFQT